MCLGERIKIYREGRGLTQEDLARETNMGVNTIRDIENGRSKEVKTVDQLIRLAKILCVTTDDLLGLREKKGTVFVKENFNYKNELSKNLRMYRELLNYSLENLSKKSGVSKNLITKYQSIRNPKSISLDNISKLSIAMDIPTDILLGVASKNTYKHYRKNNSVIAYVYSKSDTLEDELYCALYFYKGCKDMYTMWECKDGIGIRTARPMSVDSCREKALKLWYAIDPCIINDELSLRAWQEYGGAAICKMQIYEESLADIFDYVE